MSKFKYGGRDAATVDARARQKGGDYDSIVSDEFKVLKVREGNVNLRILPYTWDTKKYGKAWAVEVWAHERIGSDKGNYLCLDKMLGKPCPICEALNDFDEEDRKAIKARKKVISWVIDRDNEKEGPQLWISGWKLEKALNARSRDKKSNEILFIDDPEEGYDISFVREGSRLNTQYVNEDIARSPSPIHENERKQEAWLEYITKHPVPSTFLFQDYEYIQEIFMGRQSADNDDDADEDDKKPQRPTRGRGRQSEPEADEDEDNKRPAPRRPTRASRDAEPEEDEDELPDDEQMEDNSTSGRATGRKAPPRRSREAELEDEEDDDNADDEPRPGRVRDDVTPRRSRREAEEEDEPEEEAEEETSTTRARRTLTSMKPGKKAPARRR